MRHHLRKAKDIYSTKGLVQTAISAFKYAPVEFNNLVFHARHGLGTQIMDEDWDNLLILDSCRYDMFEELVGLDGTLESRISLGSSSEEFLEQNFESRTCHETVYVNANPYVFRLGLDKGTFHAVVDCLADWDDELQTVRPATVAQAAREAAAEFPNKRLIVHFMQPHTPFIGELGQELIGGGWKIDSPDEEDPGIWHYLRHGETDLDLEIVWEAYRENLEVVLSEVGPLLESLNGKTVITADHGNLVGERYSPIPSRRKYGHPYGVHVPELTKVPWFLCKSANRRKIRSDPPVKSDGISDETIEERLQALGYR